MESLINNVDLNDIINASILIGIIFCSLVNLTHSLEVYLLNKAWRVNDYERIIDKYTYLDDAEDNVEFEIISNAKISHKKRLLKIEKREKFLNKFRRNKKDV